MDLGTPHDLMKASFRPGGSSASSGLGGPVSAPARGEAGGAGLEVGFTHASLLEEGTRWGGSKSFFFFFFSIRRAAPRLPRTPLQGTRWALQRPGWRTSGKRVELEPSGQDAGGRQARTGKGTAGRRQPRLPRPTIRCAAGRACLCPRPRLPVSRASEGDGHRRRGSPEPRAAEGRLTCAWPLPPVQRSAFSPPSSLVSPSSCGNTSQHRILRV